MNEPFDPEIWNKASGIYDRQLVFVVYLVLSEVGIQIKHRIGVLLFDLPVLALDKNIKAVVYFGVLLEVLWQLKHLHIVFGGGLQIIQLHLVIVVVHSLPVFHGRISVLGVVLLQLLVGILNCLLVCFLNFVQHIFYSLRKLLSLLLQVLLNFLLDKKILLNVPGSRQGLNRLEEDIL